MAVSPEIMETASPSPVLLDENCTVKRTPLRIINSNIKNLSERLDAIFIRLPLTSIKLLEDSRYIIFWNCCIGHAIC